MIRAILNAVRHPLKRPSAPLERRSIQRQIMSLGVRMTMLTLLLLAVLMDAHVVYKRVQDLRGALDTQARLVAASSAAAVVFGNADEARETLRYLVDSPDVRQAQLFLTDGRPLASYQRAGDETPCHTLQPQALGSVRWRWCGVVQYEPVRLYDRSVGMLALEMSLASGWQQVLMTLLYTALVVLLAVVVTVPLWRRLALRLSRPLGDLVRVTREVGVHHDFTLRSRTGGSQEAQALAEAFNRMMGELQQRDALLNQELRQRRLAEVRLNDLAYFDPITSLHNRHYFKERIEAAAQEARTSGESCALLYLDLDGFKQVNDKLGHEAGDELLRQVAERLQEALRREDDICRLGGDEFAIVLSGVGGVPEVAAIAAKLGEEVARPYQLGARTAFVSASIGGCLYPNHADDADMWLRHADSAMYQVKAAGRNAFRLYDPADLPEINRAQRLQQDLRMALGGGQLSLVYQPRVQMRTGDVVGVEALLRWQHPQLGAIDPSEFVPLAEASGVIVPIGLWMLQESIAQVQAWREHAQGLHVSVNMSARQLESDAMVDKLCAALVASGLPPRAVDLELTETLLVDRSEAMLARMARLRGVGFGLAIDDFGVGYSSLAYLESFPITTLKIDRAFVEALDGGERGQAIARAIIAVGHALQVEVVAEGIERPDQAQTLMALGCDRGQGYLFAPPLPVAQVTHMLAQAPRG